MKHFNSAIAIRLFCYALILIIIFMLKVNEKNTFLLFMGLLFVCFSKIEDSILNLQHKFTLIEMLKNPFRGSFWSNFFKFFAFLFFISSIAKQYFKF